MELTRILQEGSGKLVELSRCSPQQSSTFGTKIKWSDPYWAVFPFPDDSKFSEAITVLLSWIERGEVNRRSANQFYSMVQSANSHVRRLMNEKATHEQEMEEAKENFKNALTGILTQCK